MENEIQQLIALHQRLDVLWYLRAEEAVLCGKVLNETHQTEP